MLAIAMLGVDVSRYQYEQLKQPVIKITKEQMAAAPKADHQCQIEDEEADENKDYDYVLLIEEDSSAPRVPSSTASVMKQTNGTTTTTTTTVSSEKVPAPDGQAVTQAAPLLSSVTREHIAASAAPADSSSSNPSILRPR